MNPLQKIYLSSVGAFYRLTGRLFPDAQAKFLKNKISHLVLEHQVARKKIDGARTRFEQTREHTIKTFHSAKKNTLDATHAAVAALHEHAAKEDEDIEEKYRTAKEKVQKKREVCNELTKTCEIIGTKDFPLE